jgi:hypothetical protein
MALLTLRPLENRFAASYFSFLPLSTRFFENRGWIVANSEVATDRYVKVALRLTKAILPPRTPSEGLMLNTQMSTLVVLTIS